MQLRIQELILQLPRNGEIQELILQLPRNGEIQELILQPPLMQRLGNGVISSRPYQGHVTEHFLICGAESGPGSRVYLGGAPSQCLDGHLVSRGEVGWRRKKRTDANH
jgi:hypothetical protein